jgi:hypothetical protein
MLLHQTPIQIWHDSSGKQAELGGGSRERHSTPSLLLNRMRSGGKRVSEHLYTFVIIQLHEFESNFNRKFISLQLTCNLLLPQLL